MKADTSKQQTMSVPATIPSWYKTDKDNIERDCDWARMLWRDKMLPM